MMSVAEPSPDNVVQSPGGTGSGNTRGTSVPAALVVLAGWLIPGGGYLVLGQTARGLTICVTVLALFIGGLAIGGIRVIDVPGFKQGYPTRVDSRGRPLTPQDPQYNQGTWTLADGQLFSEVLAKIWYVPQLLNGPVALWASHAALDAARRGVATTHARIMEIGTLYTAVAGVLNLLAIMDAASRSGPPPQKGET
jgi:hypothetical protein